MSFDHLLVPFNLQTTKLDMTPRSLNVLSELLVRDHRFLHDLRQIPDLSAAVISRLTAEWKDEYEHWQKRNLSVRRHVYVWADGVYLHARMEDNAECMLVLIGATSEGKKELVGFQV